MKQLFINLPVKDLEASKNFYSEMGFTNNPIFTFEDQICMMWGESIYLMLQTHEMSKKGANKNLTDPKQNRIATFTLPVESLAQVNQMMEKGLKAGGTESTEPIDEGFMQIRNIEDLDGHNWGIIFLDLEKFKEMTGKQ